MTRTTLGLRRSSIERQPSGWGRHGFRHQTHTDTRRRVLRIQLMNQVFQVGIKKPRRNVSKGAALKPLQAETAAELDALLPALLDRAFKGEL